MIYQPAVFVYQRNHHENPWHPGIPIYQWFSKDLPTGIRVSKSLLHQNPWKKNLNAIVHPLSIHFPCPIVIASWLKPPIFRVNSQAPPQAAPPESDRTAAAQRTHPGPTDGPLGRREMAEAMEWRMVLVGGLNPSEKYESQLGVFLILVSWDDYPIYYGK